MSAAGSPVSERIRVLAWFVSECDKFIAKNGPLEFQNVAHIRNHAIVNSPFEELPVQRQMCFLSTEHIDPFNQAARIYREGLEEIRGYLAAHPEAEEKKENTGLPPQGMDEIFYI